MHQYTLADAGTYLIENLALEELAKDKLDWSRGVLKDLKAMLQRDVIVKPDVHLHHEQFDVMSIGG